MAPLAHLLKGFDVNPYIDFGSGKGDKTDLEDRRSVKVPLTITVLGITIPLDSAQRFFEKLPRTGTNDNSIMGNAFHDQKEKQISDKVLKKFNDNK